MKLKAPDNFGGAVVNGHAYSPAEDGSIDVDPGDIEDLRSHGCTDWVGLPPDDPRSRPEEVGDEFDALNRNGLFAWAKANGLKMGTPITLEEQRAACRAHVVAMRGMQVTAQLDAQIDAAVRGAASETPPPAKEVEPLPPPAELQPPVEPQAALVATAAAQPPVSPVGSVAPAVQTSPVETDHPLAP